MWSSIHIYTSCIRCILWWQLQGLTDSDQVKAALALLKNYSFFSSHPWYQGTSLFSQDTNCTHHGNTSMILESGFNCRIQFKNYPTTLNVETWSESYWKRFESSVNPNCEHVRNIYWMLQFQFESQDSLQRQVIELWLCKTIITTVSPLPLAVPFF